MFTRVREAARTKLERLLTEVLARHAGEQTAAADRRADRLVEELRATRAELVGLEVRMRRDLHFAAEVSAAASSAWFVHERMPTVPTFGHPHETLRFAAGLVAVEGMVCEFGVASGQTLRLLTDQLPGRFVAGFDVFTGLPEDWRTGSRPVPSRRRHRRRCRAPSW